MKKALSLKTFELCYRLEQRLVRLPQPRCRSVKWALFPVLLILSREFLITGLRLVAAGKGKNLAAEKLGKLKTVIQLTCISLYLAKIAIEIDFKEILPTDLHLQAIELFTTSGHLTLLAATILTVFSGLVYLIKYWGFFIEENN